MQYGTEYIMKTPRQRKARLGWRYIAGYFDASGSLFPEHGWRSKLRINSYSRKFLEDIRTLVDSGSIITELKPRGSYYRWEINGQYRVQQFLRRVRPHLRIKRSIVQKWLTS